MFGETSSIVERQGLGVDGVGSNGRVLAVMLRMCALHPAGTRKGVWIEESLDHFLCFRKLTHGNEE